jgi:hypothetical protein
MVIACILGLIGGLIGAVPLLVVRRLALKPGTVIQQQAIVFGLLGVACSLVLCIAMMFIYRQFDAENFLGFGITLVITFLIANSVAIIRGMIKRT